MRWPISIVLSVALSGCMNEVVRPDCLIPLQQPPPSPSPSSAGMSLSEDGTDLIDVSGRLLVLQSRHTDRTTEVLGLLDVHVPSGGQAAALAALRSQAIALGADAVVGADFHHGESGNESIHVSGMAIRFIELAR